MSTTEVRKFRKRPVVVEAIQYEAPNRDYSEGNGTKGNIDLLQEFGAEVEPRGEWDPPEKAEILVRTLEGLFVARPGDWIIRGVQGEFYPCKPDIFEQTYEEAV